ncbi:maleylpyruvate isomerase N-terminal domain-containing protein [Pseudonocardia nigra]|uniref:maleylpyruvate isomerase N-terminal domain-containing protein n=1 Tax=Pseudonocardia nigra TaxID=1921578 RepID=UPI001C5E589E|nr:maleylpyruvate isomerase N-terminal domain-containing protein [Pseudonocardia nigra]
MDDSTFDQVRSAATEQFALLARRVSALDDGALERPTRLDGWRVAELVAHLARNWDAVRSGLDKPAPAQAEVGLVEYYDGAQAVASAVRARSIDDAAAIPREHLRRHLAAVVDEVSGRLAREPHDRLILARLGSLGLRDFLVTRCVEGVVHGLDLADALTGAPTEFVHPAAAHECLTLLVARLPAPAAELLRDGAATDEAGTAALIEHLTGRTPRGSLDPRLLTIPPVLR